MKITSFEESGFRRMPWVNGGGETTELHAQLDPITDRIVWRISMADVSSAGPFSHFDGYDRILVLLEGRGLSLSFENGDDCELQQRFDFVEFAGDIKTYANIADGPIRDFNVIVDRERFKPIISIVNDGENVQVLPNAEVVVAYAADGDAVIGNPDKCSYPMLDGSLLVIEGPAVGDWSVSGSTTIVVQLLSLEGCCSDK